MDDDKRPRRVRMPDNFLSVCDKCGRNVRKVTEHAITGKKLCLKCMTESGIFTLREEDLIIFKDERRGSIRIPLSVRMTFIIYGDNEPKEERYTATGINVSTAGLCFTWDACNVCDSYAEGDIHPRCIFYPYFIRNPEHTELTVEMMITRTFFMKLKGYTVYTMKEEDSGIEYVGMQFVNLEQRDRILLEKIIFEYTEGGKRI